MIKTSIKKPYTVFVGVILVIVLGVVSFLGLKTDLLPTIDLPYVVVVTTYPGANPEKVEVAVTQPLEQSISTVSGLVSLQSVSSENMSMLILEFNESSNMDSIMLELNNNIEMVRGYFDDMVSPPMILKINPDMMPVQMISVDVEGMDIKELTAYVENELAPQLERIDGVASVDVSGSVEDFVEIKLNQDKIDEINESILNAVSSDLYNTKRELDNAKNDIANSKTDLINQSNEVYAQFGEASAQLDSTQASLVSVDSEKVRLESEKAIVLQQQTLLDTKKGLLAYTLQIQTLITQSDSLLSNPLISDAMSFTEILTLSPTSSDIIYGIIASQLVLESDSITTFKINANEAIVANNANISNVDASLLAMGVDQSIIDAADRTLLDGKVSQLDSDIITANLISEGLQATLQTLQKSYADLEKAKLETTASLAVGQAQLASAEMELDAGIKEFESAQKQALEQANIDSLVTQSTISSILSAQNFSMPAGYVGDKENKIAVKIGDKFTTIEQLQDLLLLDMNLDGVDPIYLKDVAEVSIQDNSDEQYTRVNGNPGVTIAIQKSSLASTTDVTKSVNDEIETLLLNNEDLSIATLLDQGVYINIVIDSVMTNLVYGGLIAFLVLLVFLKDLRPTLIIGFSIPISLVFSIVLMYFSNVNLNIISLSGLSLGVGMLVDNSIVVIENIYRLRNLGYSKVKAATIGASQVMSAILASTLTTVCVFLPIVFADGISRQLFTDMGLTIAYSLFASLIVALTLVPAMASTMLKARKVKQNKFYAGMLSFYDKTIRFNLKHKFIIILSTLGLLVLSLYNTLSMPLEMIPAMDSTQLQMTLEMDDTTEEELINHGEIIADRILNIEGVETVGVTAGSSSMSAMMGSEAQTKFTSLTYYIILDENAGVSNVEVESQIKKVNPEYLESISIMSSNMDISALGGTGISLILKGNNLDTLQSEATLIADIIKNVEGVEDALDGSQEQVEELRVDVNKTKAMAYNLTVAQVYQLLSTELTETTQSTTMTFSNVDLDTIIVGSVVKDADAIKDIVVATKTVKDKEVDVKLEEIAEIYYANGPSSINRDNQSRTQTVTIIIEEGFNPSLVSRDVEKALENYTPPVGYSYEFAGENEMIVSTIEDLILMITLAIIFIYLIMVAQFQSLMSPFIVLFTIPLAFTGGLLALQITDQTLSITSMVGFLVLAGIVVNNGIVFVDYVNQLRLEGLDKKEALIQAGKDRIRPIFMTALTTILAMSTMALGVGMGAQMTQGMAIVAIGGLSYATVLTLYLVPALYDILHKKPLKKIEVNFEEEDHAI